MTKWARMRRRKERRRVEETTKHFSSEENETKLAEPEKVSDNVKHSQEKQKLDTPKTSKLNTILSQIPGYVYLVAIFALLSGVFFPLITPYADGALNLVIGGTAALLFLGLIGGIFLFKAATSDKGQRVFLVIGFVLITASLVLIYTIIDLWLSDFGFF